VGWLQRYAYALVAATFAAVTAIDVSTKVGIAAGMLYVIPVVLSMAAGRPWAPVFTALVSSALSITSYLFKPAGYPDVALPNRAMMIAIIWIAALVCERHVRTESRLAAERAAIESALGAIAYTSLDGRVLDVNRSTLSMWGYDGKDEVVGRPLVSLYADEAAASRSWDETVRNGSWSGELKGRRKNGTLFDVRVRRVAISARGHEGFIASSMMDISDLKMAQEELVLSERKFRDLVENVGAMIFRVDRDNRFVFVNRYGLEFLGYAEDELLGKPLFGTVFPLVDSEGTDYVKDSERLFRGPPAAVVREVECIKRSGERAWISLSIAAQHDAAGGFDGILAIGTDISELRRARQALLESDRRIISFLDSMALGGFVLDSAGHPYYMNKSAEQILGKGLDKSVSLERLAEAYGLYEVGTGRLYPVPKMPMLRALRGMVAVAEDMEVRRADGAVLVRVTSSPVIDRRGEVIYSVSVIEDVTERKRTEERIAQLNEDLRRRQAELEAANMELEAFSYSVSHDLRAPLRAIDGFCHAVIDDYGDRLDATGRDYLQRVRRATQHMGELIDDLLNLSRVTRAGISIQDVDLSAIAHEVIDELQAQAPDRKVEWVIQEGLRDRADERLMRIALANLLGNAWKFTRRQPGPRIEFGRRTQHGEAAYFVRDNGAGFDMSFAGKLFMPFQRLHRTDEFEGTGIGLATVWRIVKKHGGRAWAEGEVGKGATFYFTLR